MRKSFVGAQFVWGEGGGRKIPIQTGPADSPDQPNKGVLGRSHVGSRLSAEGEPAGGATCQLTPRLSRRPRATGPPGGLGLASDECRCGGATSSLAALPALPCASPGWDASVCPPGPRRKRAGRARPERTPPAMQIYIPISTHPGFTPTSPTTSVRALAPGGPTLRSIFRGPRGPPGPGAQRPSKKTPPRPPACQATDPAPRPKSTPGANWHEDPAVSLVLAAAAPTTPGAPPSTGTNASPPGRLAGHGMYMCMGCPRAAPTSARPVNWHQRPRPDRTHDRTRARRQLARRLWCESVSRACLPNWHQRLRPVVSFLSFLPPREPPRPAVTEGPPSPANWHRALRARQPSRRPLQSPRRRSTGAIARSSQARPGHRQPESPKSHASVNWHVGLHARRSRGWPRARRASPPPVPRRCRGH